MNGQAGTHASLFAAYFPGEPFTITFEPTVEQSDAMTRMVAARAVDDDESTLLLQMLGIIPSESAFNPTARDAWTKKKPTVTESGTCKNGHARDRYTFINSAGARRCRECHRISKRASEQRAREKKAA